MNTTGIKSLAVAGAIFALGSSAYAINLNYAIGTGSSVTAYTGSENGLQISSVLNPNLSTINFNLNDSQSFTFNFFTISTPESAVNSDDKAPKTISATLEFGAPLTSATVGGDTVGVTTGLFGHIEFGEVTWNGPVDVTVGDREFQVTLSNEIFNEGILFGLGRKGAVVKATVEQLSSVEARSDPAPDSGTTCELLGAAIVALGAVKRRLS